MSSYVPTSTPPVRPRPARRSPGAAWLCALMLTLLASPAMAQIPGDLEGITLPDAPPPAGRRPSAGCATAPDDSAPSLAAALLCAGLMRVRRRH